MKGGMGRICRFGHLILHFAWCGWCGRFRKPSTKKRSADNWFVAERRSALTIAHCCKARSRAEFISKIGIVEEEINESVYWLELIISALVLPSARVAPLLNEARELEKIFAASRMTACRNR